MTTSETGINFSDRTVTKDVTQMLYESWLPITGYEGFYEISNYGRVLSIRSGKCLKLVLYRTPSGAEYHQVTLYDSSGKRSTKSVHSLVAKQFLSESSKPDLEVCHKNGDGTDNIVTNLRWGTRNSNQKDRVRHGRHHNANKTHCPMGAKLELPNLQPKPLHDYNMRVCLACSRMRSHISHKKNKFGTMFTDDDRKRIHDDYLKEIL